MRTAPFPRAMELLRGAPRDTRTAFAMPLEPGMSNFEDPLFLAATEAWIDGQRVLIEYMPDEGGRVETVALDRDALAAAIERAWYAMMDVSERIRAGQARSADDKRTSLTDWPRYSRTPGK